MEKIGVTVARVYDAIQSVIDREIVRIPGFFQEYKRLTDLRIARNRARRGIK